MLSLFFKGSGTLIDTMDIYLSVKYMEYDQE